MLYAARGAQNTPVLDLTYQGGVAKVLCEQGSRRIVHCNGGVALVRARLDLTGALEKKRRAGAGRDNRPPLAKSKSPVGWQHSTTFLNEAKTGFSLARQTIQLDIYQVEFGIIR
jgi:hypothetical protein